MSQNQEKDHKHTPFIIILLIVSIVIFFFICYQWYKESIGNNEPLMSANYLAGIFSTAISAVTIYLLYKTYNHQIKELADLNKANRDLVTSTNKANNLQVVIYEKRIVTDELNRLIESFTNKYEEGSTAFISVINSKLKDIYYIKNIKRLYTDGLISNELKYSTISLFKIDTRRFTLIIDFILSFNHKIRYMSKFWDEDLMNIFITSLSTNLIELIEELQSEDFQNGFSVYDINTYAPTDEIKNNPDARDQVVLYHKIHYISNKTPILKELVDHYSKVLKETN